MKRILSHGGEILLSLALVAGSVATYLANQKYKDERARNDALEEMNHRIIQNYNDATRGGFDCGLHAAEDRCHLALEGSFVTPKWKTGSKQ